MSDYVEGHVKRDPVSGAVAIRTMFSEADPQLATMAWLVATHNMGAKHSLTESVVEWDDLFIPNG